MNNINKMNNIAFLYNNFINSNDLNDMNCNRTKKCKSNRKKVTIKFKNLKIEILIRIIITLTMELITILVKMASIIKK